MVEAEHELVKQNHKYQKVIGRLTERIRELEAEVRTRAAETDDVRAHTSAHVGDVQQQLDALVAQNEAELQELNVCSPVCNMIK